MWAIMYFNQNVLWMSFEVFSLRYGCLSQPSLGLFLSKNDEIWEFWPACSQGCAIVETGSRYQYQYLMTLGCNTNININNKRSGFATSIPISIVVQLILQYQYWYENHILQICNINFNNNIKSLILAIPITPQYHLILQYLGININIWFNNSTIKWFLGVNFTHSNA